MIEEVRENDECTDCYRVGRWSANFFCKLLDSVEDQLVSPDGFLAFVNLSIFVVLCRNREKDELSRTKLRPL